MMLNFAVLENHLELVLRIAKKLLIKNSFDVEKAIIFLKIKAGEIRVTQEFLDIYTKFENY
jgi:hypothetical protein